MQQRDLIKEQIEQAGRVLGKILFDFYGEHPIDIVEPEAVKQTDDQLEDFLGFSLLDIEAIAHDELNQHLTHITPEHLRQIVEYLKDVAVSYKKQGHQELSNQYSKAGLASFEIMKRRSDTYQLEWGSLYQQLMTQST